MEYRAPTVPGTRNVRTRNVCSSHHKGNQESVAAFNVVKPVTRSMRKLILKEFEQNPEGLTCDEIEAKLGLKHQTASARLRELVDGSELVRTTEKRPTRSGCNAAVYMTVDQYVNRYCRTASSVKK